MAVMPTPGTRTNVGIMPIKPSPVGDLENMPIIRRSPAPADKGLEKMPKIKQNAAKVQRQDKMVGALRKNKGKLAARNRHGIRKAAELRASIPKAGNKLKPGKGLPFSGSIG